MENYKNPITFVVMAKRHGTRKLYWWGWIFRLRKSGGNDWPHCVPLKLFIVQPQSLWEVKGSCKKVPSAETQGNESGREKLEARPKFSSTGGRAPGYRLSQDHFQTVKWECWLLIGHKQCFVLLCPIGEQFLLSSFREFVHDGYYLPTVAWFVHQAFLTRQRNYWWVEKRFRCYQQEQFNLHWENSVSDSNNRKFKMRWRQEIEKSN